jgi:Zn-dependent M16 (insulinase) family peptidase
MVEQSSGFVLKKEQRVPSLNITAQLFEHARTGALHLHLESAEKENVFLVALRTIPQDSTGVAHILEHTALCGSEKYPVRDPFFMMIRRSVNTFMNAFTSSDWTAYPFASVNRTDFDNLLEVYLDAVFFSRIDELDFRQEGHRLDLVTPEDVAGSELCFKGVVYNEMKGAMSAPSSRAWHTLCENLFPSSTYHFNSGGDPEVIPDLEYEALKAFYAKHYHPSNALFVTFGDIPAHSHQHRFETLALNRFERLDETIEVSLEAPFEVPRIALGRYPVTVKENEAKAYQLMAWLLDESTDIETALEAELLNGLLLANSSAPLQNFLETTPLGTHPSSLCGLETSMRQMVFVCGLEGAKTEVASEFENEVLALLRSVAEEGVPQEQIDAMIHQMELQHREISGGSYPYGLHIILRVLPALIHRGDPFKLLDMDAALETLREKAAQPDFVKTLIHRFLLDNPHRLLMTMKPDPLLAQEEAQREKERLELMAQNLDEAARQRILELNSVLAERQQRQDDDSILPKIRVSEISHEMKFPEYRNIKLADYSCTLFDAPTQGLVYQRMVVDLPDLDASEMRWLGFFSSCLSELGVASLDYRQRQARQTLWTGGVGASSLAFSDLNDEQKVTGFFVFSGKALSRNQAHLCDLMDDVLKRARFDEVEHMKDILKRSASHAEQSIVPNGHAYAMMAASSGMSPLAARAHHSTMRVLRRLPRRVFHCIKRLAAHHANSC